MNLSDVYTLMYGYLADSVIKHHGLQGEICVREATRLFGQDRGITLRKKHLSIHAKINMKNLFSLYPDLPNDPRFKRELQILSPQARISHTLFCPMADIWNRHGLKDIGRIYCEEFHPACYSSYAYDYTHVNLARTQTQGDDAYCSFRVMLRPDNLPEELRPVCFEEYDPHCVQPDFNPDLALSGKDGFEMLSIKLYYYLLASAEDNFGKDGIDAVSEGLQALARETANLLKITARQLDIPVTDDAFLFNNVPISRDYDSRHIFWDGYDGHGAVALWEKNFNLPLMTHLGK